MSGYIETNKNYTLMNNWIEISGDEVIYKDRFNDGEVPDYSEIPLERGRIAFLGEAHSSDREPYVKLYNINGKSYRVTYSYPFSKGSYIGNQYELAKMIDHIATHDERFFTGYQQHSQMPIPRMTHSGSAIAEVEGRRCLADLDVENITERARELGYTSHNKRELDPCESVLCVSAGLIIILGLALSL